MPFLPDVSASAAPSTHQAHRGKQKDEPAAFFFFSSITFLAIFLTDVTLMLCMLSHCEFSRFLTSVLCLCHNLNVFHFSKLPTEQTGNKHLSSPYSTPFCHQLGQSLFCKC